MISDIRYWEKKQKEDIMQFLILMYGMRRC